MALVALAATVFVDGAVALSLVTDINVQPNPRLGSYPSDFVDAGSQTFFRATDGMGAEQLWVMNSAAGRSGHGFDPRPVPALFYNPYRITALGSFIVATGTTEPYLVSTRRLLRSDGTAAGTFPIAEVVFDESIVVVGTTGLFLARDSGGGGSYELWRTDGSRQGTYPVVASGRGPSFRRIIGRVGDIVYLLANDEEHGDELWRTDGTAAGTYLVVDLTPGPTSTTFGVGVEWNGELYFVAAAWGDGTAIRRLRGDTGQVDVVLPLTVPGWSSIHLTPGGDRLFVSSSNAVHALRSNGAGNDPTLVGVLAMSDRGFHRRAALGRLFFWGATPGGRHTIWSSDGTVEGTQALVESSLTSGEIVEYGEQVYFVSDDALWRSDGTQSGTVLVRSFSTGAPSNPATAGPSKLVSLMPAAGGLMFAGDDAVYGKEPWWSDGTVAGTVLVGDLAQGTSDSNPEILTDHAGILHFVADDGVSGKALWRSDGHTTDRRWAPPAGYSIHGMLSAADRLMVSLHHVDRGYELWQFTDDGNEASFVAIAAPAGSGARFDLNGGIVTGEMLVAAVSHDIRNGWQAIAIDLLRGASQLLLPAPKTQAPRAWTPFAGRLYFVAAEQAETVLFVTDGTGEGTHRVDSLQRISPTQMPLITTKNAIYAVGEARVLRIDSDGGAFEVLNGPRASSPLLRLSEDRFAVLMWVNDERRLWVADDGMLPEFAPASDELLSLTTILGAAGGRVYGLAPTGGGFDLWASDGTADGTVLVTTLPLPTTGRLVAGVSMYAGAEDGAAYLRIGFGIPPWMQVWRSDATPAGTGRLGSFLTPFVPRPGDIVSVSHLAGSRLFMVQTWPGVGRELFSLDLDSPLLDALDCNEDGSVGHDDLHVVLQMSFETPSNLGCPTADLDRDGTIDIHDLVAMVRQLTVAANVR